jgi:hypothetical protein
VKAPARRASTRPRRDPKPVRASPASGEPDLERELERLNLAQGYFLAATSLMRGVSASVPALAKSLTDATDAAAVIARSLDADVHALRDLADPKRAELNRALADAASMRRIDAETEAKP